MGSRPRTSKPEPPSLAGDVVAAWLDPGRTANNLADFARRFDPAVRIATIAVNGRRFTFADGSTIVTSGRGPNQRLHVKGPDGA